MTLTITALQSEAITITLEEGEDDEADGKLVLSEVDVNITVTGTGTVVVDGDEMTVAQYGEAVAAAVANAKIADAVEILVQAGESGEGTEADPIVLASVAKNDSVEVATGITGIDTDVTISADGTITEANSTNVTAVAYADGDITLSGTSVAAGTVEFTLTVSADDGDTVTVYFSVELTA